MVSGMSVLPLGTWLKAGGVIIWRREWGAHDGMTFWSMDTLYPPIHTIPQSAENTD